MRLWQPQSQIFLTLGDDGLITVPYHIPNATPFFTPTDSGNGIAEIMAFVAQHPTASVTLILDNLAQDYRADTLPRLNILDRKKLIQRRLKQNFPHAKLTSFLRRRAARNNITLIGISDNNPVFAWCERLAERLPSIVLLPIEGVGLSTRWRDGDKKGWVMMVSRHKSGGFRQIVTCDGDFVFTRLTPLPSANLPTPLPDVVAEIIARDIRASLDYLTRHGLRQASDLTVMVLMSEDIRNAAAFYTLGVKEIRSLSPFAMAEKLSLPFSPPPHSDESDLLFTAAIAAHHPRLRLRTPNIQHKWFHQNLHAAGLGFASMLLVLAITHIGFAGYDVATTLIEKSAQEKILADTQQKLRQTQAEAVPVTEPLGRLRQAVERSRLFAITTPQPWHIMNALISALPKDVLLINLDWQKESDTTSENLTLSLRPVPPNDQANHADMVTIFTHAATALAQALPDYTLTLLRTPYPDMAQDQVTMTTATETTRTPVPQGEIRLQRKTHD